MLRFMVFLLAGSEAVSCYGLWVGAGSKRSCHMLRSVRYHLWQSCHMLRFMGFCCLKAKLCHVMVRKITSLPKLSHVTVYWCLKDQSEAVRCYGLQDNIFGKAVKCYGL